jgi:hypothetical protein
MLGFERNANPVEQRPINSGAAAEVASRPSTARIVKSNEMLNDLTIRHARVETTVVVDGELVHARSHRLDDTGTVGHPIGSRASDGVLYEARRRYLSTRTGRAGENGKTHIFRSES